MLENLSRSFNLLVSPVAKDKDCARRERILNIILVGAFLLFLLLTIKTSITNLNLSRVPAGYKPMPPTVTIVICFFFLIDYLISRSGKAKLAILLLLCISFLVPTYTVLAWGAETPQALLTYSLIIVMSGVLLNSKAAFLLTGIIVALLLAITHLQLIGALSFVSSWRQRLPEVADAVVYGATLTIIAVISWLSNLEMERALSRARKSEAALRKERDLLEIRVRERTRELQQAQAEKVAQIYRFVEFGRLASGLFHDLANPINLASLNLETLNSESAKLTQKGLKKVKVALARTTEAMKRLEAHVKTAKRQLQSQEIQGTFSLTEEVSRVIDMFTHRARELGIDISFVHPSKINFNGNPPRFAQLVTNLISNAIDSYEGISRKKRPLTVTLKKQGKVIQLTVTDQGKGIPRENMSQIFKPFFTTKSIDKGIGIGLSITKEIIEKDLGGKISVKSRVNQGTTFKVTFPSLPNG